jgi:sirohydrochlorin ferrochelatase
MMGFTAQLQAAAPKALTVMDSETALQPALSRWLMREAARYRTLDADKIGVVVHAHGSNWQWNEDMRRGSAPLGDDYLIEYAFSMGDPATLEHAVRHLEERGAEAVVIVRVFGMASSFRDGIVQFIGEAWETCQPIPSNTHDHGHGSASSPPPVLDTGLPVVTVGGLEDHPLFARALYQRALDLSERPDRETVILVAHGLGNEEGNAHWRRVLESIREQMLAMGGERFRAIEGGLWSEDWPELRQSAVEHMRGLVSAANEDNGRALVIPARTLGRGPAAEYLDGLDYVQGEGFSPHPLFADWLRVQVKAGLDRLKYERNETWDCDR